MAAIAAARQGPRARQNHQDERIERLAADSPSRSRQQATGKRALGEMTNQSAVFSATAAVTPAAATPARAEAGRTECAADLAVSTEPCDTGLDGEMKVDARPPCTSNNPDEPDSRRKASASESSEGELRTERRESDGSQCTARSSSAPCSDAGSQEPLTDAQEGALGLEERLESVGRSQEALRLELEQYLAHVKGAEVVELGANFDDELVKQESIWKRFALQSPATFTSAAGSAADGALQGKIARGRERISKLDERLAKAEAKERGLKRAELAGEVELALVSDDAASGTSQVGPGRRAPRPRRGSRRQSAKAVRRGDCERVSSAPDLGRPPKASGQQAAHAHIGLSVVDRNIELASSGFSSSLTAGEEERVEQLLLEDVSGDDGDEDSTRELLPGSTRALVLDISALGSFERELDHVEAALRDMVGPDEWETKSAYFWPDDDDDVDDDDEVEAFNDAQSFNGSMSGYELGSTKVRPVLGPLLSARSASQASTLSAAQSRSNGPATFLHALNSERAAELRLKHIELALAAIAPDRSDTARDDADGSCPDADESDYPEPVVPSSEMLGELLEDARTFVSRTLNGKLEERSRIEDLLRGLR